MIRISTYWIAFLVLLVLYKINLFLLLIGFILYLIGLLIYTMIRTHKIEYNESGARRWIKGGIIVSLVSIAVTLVALILESRGNIIVGYSSIFSASLETAILLLLTFGLYKRSRICAVLIFADFLYNRVLIWIANFSGFSYLSVCVGLIIGIYMVLAITATFSYHRNKQLTERESNIAPSSFCRKCGASLLSDTVFCSKCGAKVEDMELLQIEPQISEKKSI